MTLLWTRDLFFVSVQESCRERVTAHSAKDSPCFSVVFVSNHPTLIYFIFVCFLNRYLEARQPNLVFLCKTLCSRSSSLHPGILRVPATF